MDSAATCARCGRPATSRLTVDLDIRGVPVCGDCSLVVWGALAAKLAGDERTYEALMTTPGGKR